MREINHNEIWKDIVGYEGLYQVSQLGNVRRIGDRFENLLHNFHTIKPHINNNGYYLCDLYKNNKRKNVLLHRIVAMAFCPNENELKYVNHIDSNPLNCAAYNLEWCTASYNQKYSYLYNTRKEKMNWKIGKFNAKSKSVVAYDKDGNEVMRFDCIMDAERKTGIKNNCIVNNLKCRTKSAGGYIWNYAK